MTCDEIMEIMKKTLTDYHKAQMELWKEVRTLRARVNELEMYQHGTGEIN